MSSLQDLDVLLCSEEETESSDDLSSNEGDKEDDPLEDVGFSLGNFMSNSSFALVKRELKLLKTSWIIVIR